MNNRTTFGAWVQAQRERRGWSVALCAEQMGWRWNQWQRLEADEPRRYNGEPTQPRRETVKRVALALKVDINEALHAAGYRPEPETFTSYEPSSEDVREWVSYFEGKPTSLQNALKAGVKAILDAAETRHEPKQTRRVAEEKSLYGEER